jgi:phenylacetate-CoA oxygenase PaaH subunit
MAGGTGNSDGEWPLWEVFTQAGRGAPHQHAGSVHATDAEHAMQNARDVYTRRGEAVSLWVVPAEAIVPETEQVLHERLAEGRLPRARDAHVIDGDGRANGDVQLVVLIDAHQNTFTPSGTL